MTSLFNTADRVRVIATGETGSVTQDMGSTVAVLLDGESLSGIFDNEELEHYDGPAVVPDPPIRDGLPGVGDALLGLAEALKTALPPSPEVQGKLAELKQAIAGAMPADRVEDGHGNGWVRCGAGCDLGVVRPGKVQCSGVVCGNPVDPGPDPRNPEDVP